MLLIASCTSSITSPNAAGSLSRDASSVTKAEAWNANCAKANFMLNDAVTASTTLNDLYLGLDFELDKHDLHHEISAAIGSDSGLLGLGPDALYIWFEEDGVDPN